MTLFSFYFGSRREIYIKPSPDYIYDIGNVHAFLFLISLSFIRELKTRLMMISEITDLENCPDNWLIIEQQSRYYEDDFL